MKEQINTGWNLENSYASLPEIFYSKINPKKVPSPQLIILNNTLAESLGLNSLELKTNEGIDVLSGNSVPDCSVPIAQAYAGHQFGYFTMLGDGRALLIGEQIAPSMEKFDIQLKGSGRTPYSRGGDGKAALGPMLREYIISEAMHALNIPTTRSLAVVITGESVIRDKILKGAVLTRVAKSHIRVGTYEYAASYGTKEDIKSLADYTINRHYKNIFIEENPYLSLLREVIKRQASLISKWMLVGFIHGVMNTDNMTISGETIDYGPCAFMDTYDPNTVFSSIDTYGRYAYGNQPIIAEWNLSKFAGALLPLIHENLEQSKELAQAALGEFKSLYKGSWISGMRSKLGLFNEEAEDEKLFEDLLDLMYKYKEDYTNTFVKLTFDKIEEESMFKNQDFDNWYKMWQDRLDRQKETKEMSKMLMKETNPAVIPRNHRVEEALESAENGDFSVMEKLLIALQKPFAHLPEQYEYAKLPPSSFCKYKTFCGT
ncbi:MAG: YdiU family protein [Sedimentibacter sp.]